MDIQPYIFQGQKSGSSSMIEASKVNRKRDMTHARQESGIDIHLATCREDLLAAAPRFFRKLTPAEADDMTGEVIRLLKRNGWTHLTMPVSAFLTIANYYAR